jgi:hypothetical protein
MQTADMRLIADRVEKIRPLLAGLEAPVQGAILGDLLAIWAAGHVVRGDSAATAELRNELLATHLALVRKLVPENAKLLKTDH